MKTEIENDEESNFVTQWALSGELLTATQYGPLSFIDWLKHEHRRMANDGVKTRIRYKQADNGDCLCALERA